MVFYLWNAEFVLMSNIAWKASMSMTLKESGWQHQEGEGLQGWGGGSWGRTNCFDAVIGDWIWKKGGKNCCSLWLEFGMLLEVLKGIWLLMYLTFECYFWLQLYQRLLVLSRLTWDLRYLLETCDFYLRLEIFTWDLGFLLETWVLHVMLLEKQNIQ